MLSKKNFISNEFNDFHNCYTKIFLQSNEFITDNNNHIINDNQKKENKSNYYKESNKFIKTIYNNKDFCLQLLYKKYHNIYFDSENTRQDLDFYFYLDLLILYDESLQINYIYPYDFIIAINDINKIHIEKIKKIFLSRIILDLIKNYKNFDYYDEFTEKDGLNKIAKENEDIIHSNISVLTNLSEEINEKNMIELKIDQIYLKIIISLIKSTNFNDIKNISQIFSILGLENIDLISVMNTQLNKYLFSNSFMNEYEIKEIGDISNNKIINFYYILFKYILKNPHYVYNIPFFLKQRTTLIKSIKNNLHKVKECLNANNEKIEEVLKFLINVDFYLDRINITQKNNQNLENEKDESSSWTEGKKKIHKKSKKIRNIKPCVICEGANNIIQTLSKKNPNDEEYNLLTKKYDYIPGQNKNVLKRKSNNEKDNENGLCSDIFRKRKKSIEINFENWRKKKRNLLKNKTDDIKDIDEELLILANKIICNCKFLIENTKKRKIVLKEIFIGTNYIRLDDEKFIKLIINLIDNYNENNLQIKHLVEIFDFLTNTIYTIQTNFLYDFKTIIEIYLKNVTDNFNCEYILYIPNNNKKITLYENNIVLTEANLKINDELISEMNQEKYSNLEFNDSQNEIDVLDISFDYLIEEKLTINKYNLIVINKIISGKINKTKLDYIYHLYDEYFLSYENHENFIIYDGEFEEKIKIIIKDIKICNINSDKNKNEVKVLINLSNEIFILYINLKSFEYTKEKINNIEVIKNNIINKNEEINYFIYYKKKNTNENQIINKFNKAKNFVLMLKDNKEADKLILFNFFGKRSKKIISINDIYTTFEFINQISKLSTGNKIKILIFPCRYSKEKKGFLIIILEEKQQIISEFFHEITEFELYCVCPLSIISSNDNIINEDNNYPFTKKSSSNGRIDDDFSDEKNSQLINKNNEIMYFLAGGFNTNKKEPIMIIYKLNYDDTEPRIEIEFVQKIELEINDDFNGPITFIKQLTNNNILVISSNGGHEMFCSFVIKEDKN